MVSLSVSISPRIRWAISLKVQKYVTCRRNCPSTKRSEYCISCLRWICTHSAHLPFDKELDWDESMGTGPLACHYPINACPCSHKSLAWGKREVKRIKCTSSSEYSGFNFAKNHYCALIMGCLHKYSNALKKRPPVSALEQMKNGSAIKDNLFSGERLR